MKTFLTYSNIWLSRLYKTLAVLLVLLAVLLSCVRLFLPYANNYQQEVEQYVNDAYQGEISLGQISAGWRSFGPSLVVNDVQLSDSKTLSADIDQVQISFNFWDSLIQQQLKVKDFTLIGATITIDQTRLYEAEVNNDPQTKAELDNISSLLLEQIKRYSVQDSKLVLKTEFKERTFVIQQLAWLNEDDHHQGIGKFNIEGVSTDTAKLVIDLHGQSLADLNGQVYASGSNINITSWLGKYLGKHRDKLNSSVNFQSWFKVTNGHMVAAEFELGESYLTWLDYNEQQRLTIPNGNISIHRQGTSLNYFLQSSPLTPDFNNHPWSEFYLQAQYSKGSVNTYLSNISLDNLWQIYPILQEAIPDLSAFESLQLTGNLTDLQIHKSATQLQARVNLDNLGWQYSNNIPGINNINGEILYSDNVLFADIQANDNELDFNEHFSRPIPFQQLQAQTLFHWDEQQWTLAVNDIKLSSTELSLAGDLQYHQPKEQSGELGLFAYLDRVDASKTQYYLPLSLMSENLVEYLNGAIYSGESQQVAVLVNGPVSSFPFKDNAGIFVVDGDLEQVKYRFEQQWPAIEKADVNLNFTNDSMLITANDGDLVGIPTQGVKVGIESLTGGAILTVRTPVNAQAKSIHTLMLASPLADSVGETLAFLNPNGSVNGSFSLDLPLSDTSLAVAKGSVNFQDNSINLTAPEMIFSKLQGKLSFINEAINTKDLHAIWRGLPIDLDVNGEIEELNYKLQIGLQGNWQNSHYQAQIPQHLQTYLKGNLDWQGQLLIDIDKQQGFSYQATIDSQLEQAELSLPMPFAKAKGKKVDLRATVSGDTEQSIIEARIGDKLHFYGDLNHQQVTFVRSQLVLGDEKMLLPIKGFHITAELEQANFQQWQDLVENIIDSLPVASDSTDIADNSVSLISTPERIRGNLKTVDLLGQKLTDISFNLLNKKNSWLLQLNADQIKSRFKFYHDFNNKGFEVDADFIHLVVESQEGENSNKTLSDAQDEAVIALQAFDIPALKFSCKSCKYNQINFGELLFELQKDSAQQVSLTAFSAKRKGLDLNMSGSWSEEQQSLSQVNGSLTIDDVESEVKTLGITSGIKDSGLAIKFDFNWQGGPHHFNLESLNGNVKMKIDEGYLEDIDTKGANLLSIFSLQTLVRKLSLDFRDVFSKGMFYNDIKADFKVKNGLVYTDNMTMDATSGKLKVKGNTNLVNNQLDYKMSFAPKVTSSLPIIISWMVNPIVGLAALAVDQAIEKAEVISVIDFELTGTVDEPVFKEVDRKSRNINVGTSKPPVPTEQEKPSKQQIEQNTGANND